MTLLLLCRTVSKSPLHCNVFAVPGLPVPGQQTNPGRQGPLPHHLLPPGHLYGVRVRQEGGSPGRPTRSPRPHPLQREAQREGEEEEAEKVQGFVPGDLPHQVPQCRGRARLHAAEHDGEHERSGQALLSVTVEERY